MTQYVLSTMTNSVNYAFYNEVGGLPTVRESVTIFGGANLPSLRSGFGEMQRTEDGTPMWTAAGMVTPVSDAKYEVLKGHVLFNKHIERGLLKVVNRDITGNHKAVQKEVVTMEQSDDYAQMNGGKMALKVKVKNAELEADTQFRI